MKIGIDIGGSHIAIGVIEDFKLIEKKEINFSNVDLKEKELVNTIEEYIVNNIKELESKYLIENIGISIPGTIVDNKILKSANLNLLNYDIVTNLNKYIKYPIKLINDGKAAAIAENKLGCLKDAKRSIFLTLGTGIGGAVIIDNKLLNTGKYPGVEVGHMIIEKNGLDCKCGKKGCFEKYGSMLVLKTKLRKYLKKELKGIELKEILEKNELKKDEDKDKAIEEILNSFIRDLAIGITNLVNIFEPEYVGIGGSFIYFKDILLNRLIKYLEENKMFFNNNKIVIRTAELGNDAGIIGAIIE